MIHYIFLNKSTQYLKGTSNLGLVFTPSSGDEVTILLIYTPPKHSQTPNCNNVLSISSDADFSNDLNNIRSINDTIITLNHTPVALFSRKQKSVAISTIKTEYRSIASALQVGIQIQIILISLLMISKKLVTEVLTNNQPTLDMLFSLGGTKVSNFIDLRHQFIQYEITKRKIEYKHVPSLKMKADILKKSLSRHKFTTNRNSMFLFDCVALGNEGACANKN